MGRAVPLSTAGRPRSAETTATSRCAAATTGNAWRRQHIADATALLRPLGGEPPLLVPLREDHRESLAAACAADADIWPIYAISYDPDHFDASFTALLASPARLPVAIIADGRVVGMSAYIAPDTGRATVEIGNTFIHPAMRGSGLNRRAKDLLIDHAFACGFRRIEFRIDVRNARSQAAVAKLGAVREGVLRQERVTWTGHVRDTALYAILATEWRSATAQAGHRAFSFGGSC